MSKSWKLISAIKTGLTIYVLCVIFNLKITFLSLMWRYNEKIYNNFIDSDYGNYNVDRLQCGKLNNKQLHSKIYGG